MPRQNQQFQAADASAWIPSSPDGGAVCVEEFSKRRLCDVVDAVLRNFHLADVFKRHPLRRLQTAMRRLT